MSFRGEKGVKSAGGRKSTREKMKALYSLALNARYGNEEARRIMREIHGVNNPADYSGFMHGINEAIAVVDLMETQNGG